MPQDWAEKDALINELSAAVGGHRDVVAVLGDPNWTGAWGHNQSATRMRNHDWTGFVWDDGDMDVFTGIHKG